MSAIAPNLSHTDIARLAESCRRHDRGAGKRLATGGEWPGDLGSAWADELRALRAPSGSSLVREYEAVAYACANANARAVAAAPYRLYVTTEAGQRAARWPTRPVGRKDLRRIRSSEQVPSRAKAAEEIAEVERHPVLDLLDGGGTPLSGFLLRYLVQLYQETVGTAPVLIERVERGPLEGTPVALWILPAHEVTVQRGKELGEWVRSFKWGQNEFEPEQVAFFRFPSLSDPYCSGTSPLRAAWQGVSLQDKQYSHMHSSLDHRARPDVIASPKATQGQGIADVFGEESARRLEQQWNKKFRAGGSGAGGILVPTHPLDIEVPTFPPRDLELVQFHGLAKEDVANAFGVPIAILTKETNMANLEASRALHAENAVHPRLMLFDAVINESLLPLFDPDGRLFLLHDDPRQENVERQSKVRESQLKTGQRTINELRADDGQEPLPGGDEPLVGTNLQPLDFLVPTSDGGGQAAAGEEPADAEEQQEPEGEEAVLAILCSYYRGDEDREAATTALRRLGVSARHARTWTTPLKPTDTEWRDHLRQHHDGHERAERCHPSGEADWHRRAKQGAEGHGRRLPVGAEIADALRGIFRRQRRAALDYVQAQVEKALGRRRKAIEDALEFPDGFFDDWTEDMRRQMAPVLQAEAEEGAHDLMVRLGATDAAAAWRVQLPQVRQAVEEMALAFAESTNATTSRGVSDALAALREELAEGMLEGRNTVAELTRRVRRVFDQASRFRAARIAQTESSRATHLGQQIAAEQSGTVRGFRWLLSADACPWCQDVAGEVELGEAFFDDGTGGPYSRVEHPPLHPWCACTVTEVLYPPDDREPGEGWD